MRHFPGLGVDSSSSLPKENAARNDLAVILALPEGRRIIRRFLEDVFLYQQEVDITLPENELRTITHLQNYGIDLMRIILSIDPEIYAEINNAIHGKENF